MSDSARPGQAPTSVSDESPIDDKVKNEENAGTANNPEQPDFTSDNKTSSDEAASSQWNILGADLEYPNPLLDCLVLLSKYFHNPYSADSIAAGLPLTDNDMTPALFKRAAKRIGISSRFIKRPLLKIPDMVLPTVLLLKDQHACVLLEVNQQEGFAKVMRPEAGEGEITLPLDELLESYSGYCFFVKPIYQFDKRSEKESEKASKKHWFWGTITQSWRIYRDVFIASLLINIFAVASPLFVMNWTSQSLLDSRNF